MIKNKDGRDDNNFTKTNVNSHAHYTQYSTKYYNPVVICPHAHTMKLCTLCHTAMPIKFKLIMRELNTCQ